jgi:hypothetical protein
MNPNESKKESVNKKIKIHPDLKNLEMRRNNIELLNKNLDEVMNAEQINVNKDIGTLYFVVIRFNISYNVNVVRCIPYKLRI